MERKINDLTSSLQNIKTKMRDRDSGSEGDEQRDNNAAQENAANTVRAPVLGPIVRKENDPNGHVNVVEQHFLTLEDATFAFDCFVYNFLPLFCIIVFHIGRTVAEIRQREPALFLAMLSAASGIYPVNTQCHIS